MDAPVLKTPLPGPKAAALIARDSKAVSPSYTRDYPLVMAGGHGAVGRGRGRQPVPRLRGRHRGQLHGPLASRGGEGHRRPGAEVPPHVRHGLLLRAAGPARRSHGRDRPDHRRGPHVLRQFGHRSRRGDGQAREIPLEALRDHRLPRLVPRPHHGLALAHLQQDDAAEGVRAAGPGGVSRAVSEPVSRAGGDVARVVRTGLRGLDRAADPRAT